MPLLNYTTKVDVYTTLGAIQGQLVKHGAKKIMQDYDGEGNISALSFLIDTPAGPRGIRLPADERGAWRIVKDWVEAQMAILESEMVQMDEIFLPYMIDNTGKTLFEAYRNNQLALTGGVSDGL